MFLTSTGLHLLFSRLYYFSFSLSSCIFLFFSAIALPTSLSSSINLSLSNCYRMIVFIFFFSEGFSRATFPNPVPLSGLAVPLNFRYLPSSFISFESLIDSYMR